ncbi:MAG TPA: chorismate synthase [Flavobacteriales bacterium]|nr:chorismate synthase [Flavobacteriales bacterium]
MTGNSFGNIFKLTSYGESHGQAIGGIIEGCPAGLTVDSNFIQTELNRRRPGQSSITTQRNEADAVKILSGVFQNKTTGTPIGFEIPNTDHQSEDYDNVKSIFRPSHADFTYEEKYGTRDHRGGGRSSARETASRVVAGAFAKLFLQTNGIGICAFVRSVGTIESTLDIDQIDESKIESTPVRCPDAPIAQKMIAAIEKAKNEGDSLGGTITCIIKGLPAGLGQPVFDKFHAVLGHAMLSINAVKGFEYGSGFAGTQLNGSSHNDEFTFSDGKIKTTTNHSGGVQGGITNGMPVYFTVAFKPTATILKEQNTVDANGNQTTLAVKGRHDPCVLPRAVPIVEAMAAMVCADFILLNRTTKI